MKKCWLQAGIICLVATAPGVQAESTVSYFGGVAFGYTTLDFDTKLDSLPIFESMTVTGGLTLDNYSLNLSYADSVGNSAISEEEDTGEGGRTDLDLILLYRVNAALNIFLGYKDSETKIDFTLRDDVVVRQEFYRKDGWFAGITYNIGLKSAGTLGFSLSYVDLKTNDLFKADVEDAGTPVVEEFDDLSGRHKGNADGWSYGINWLVPVNDNLFINTTYKINEYDQDIVFEGTTYSADQKLTFFKVGIIYLF